MPKPDLKVFNNLSLQARDEYKRLTLAVIDNQAERLEMGGDSSLHDFYEGNVFAVARHLDIPLRSPFDKMDDDHSFEIFSTTPEECLTV
ncbi:MAG: hypothetical protein ACRBDI_09645 [Alphaproteobacteria bacterium]